MIKSDGDQGHYSTLLIHAGESYYEQLAFLLTVMFTHGFQLMCISIPEDYRETLSEDNIYIGA